MFAYSFGSAQHPYEDEQAQTGQGQKMMLLVFECKHHPFSYPG